MKFLTFDVETTGLPPKNANYETDFNDFPRIVSIAWKVDDEPVVEYIINQQGFLIPQGATDVHGITNEMAEASKHVIGDILPLMVKDGSGADKIIGHGLYFDTSTIKANALRLAKGDLGNELYKGLTELLHKDKRIDTMHSTTKFCKLPGRYPGQYKWPKLTELHQKLFSEGFDAHSSGADVSATYRSFKKLLELKVVEL